MAILLPSSHRFCSEWRGAELLRQAGMADVQIDPHTPASGQSRAGYQTAFSWLSGCFPVHVHRPSVRLDTTIIKMSKAGPNAPCGQCHSLFWMAQSYQFWILLHSFDAFLANSFTLVIEMCDKLEKVTREKDCYIQVAAIEENLLKPLIQAIRCATWEKKGEQKRKKKVWLRYQA
jgi:hypothetical protein